MGRKSRAKRDRHEHPDDAITQVAGGYSRSSRRRRRAPPRRRVPPTAHRRAWGRTPQGSSRLPVACQRRLWGIPRVQPRTLVLLAPPSYAKGRLCAGPKRCGNAGGVACCARPVGLGRECEPMGRHPAERLAAGIAPGGVQLGYVAIEELAYLCFGAVPAEFVFKLVDYSVVYDARDLGRPRVCPDRFSRWIFDRWRRTSLAFVVPGKAALAMSAASLETDSRVCWSNWKRHPSQ